MFVSDCGWLPAAVLLLALSISCAPRNVAAAESLPPNHARMVVTTPQGDRSYVVHEPAAHDGGTLLPLVIIGLLWLPESSKQFFAQGQ